MQISIIGDSASSTIGENTNIYPRILYNRISKERNCQIRNYAVPGMTSSDAKSLYFSEIKNLDNDILIIYLGNNETTFYWLADPVKVLSKGPNLAFLN